MNKYVVKNILFPLHEALCKRSTFRLFKNMVLRDSLSLRQIKQEQSLNLEKLLVHCRDNVPFYKEILGGGKLSEEIFKALPLMEKNEIRKNNKGLRATNYRQKLISMSTGGSSGVPLQFYVDRGRLAHDKASRLRYWHWWDVECGDREIILWSSPNELSAQNFLKAIRDKLFNSVLLSARKLDSLSLGQYVDMINKIKPVSIYGYAGAIFLLAKHILSKQMSLTHSPQVIFATGEVLLDIQKQAIESAFGCRVVKEYGARDVGLIAHECSEGNLHINEDIILEVVDSNGDILEDGKSGEIVATNLKSYGMPFLRYKTGDLGSIINVECACGRKSSILGELLGRSNDFLVKSDNQKVHSSIMNHIFRDIKGVEQFKVIQNNYHNFLIDIVKETHSEINADYISSRFSNIFGSETKVYLNFVEEIKPEDSGKHKYVISMVSRTISNDVLA
jgi:phenylacetate-CoA ligase